MSASQNRHLSERFTSFSRFCSVGVIGIGLFVLAGWIFNIQTFKSLLPGLSTMKANTAIAFVLGGIALWFAGRKVPKSSYFRVAQICGGVFSFDRFAYFGAIYRPARFWH